MNPTNINDLSKTMVENSWFEGPTAPLSVITGGKDLEPNQMVFTIKKNDGTERTITNFGGIGVKGFKPASVSTLLQIATQEMLSHETWVGGCRVDALMKYAATHPTLKTLLGKQDVGEKKAKDYGHEIVDEDHPGVGNYMLALSSACREDVFDRRFQKDKNSPVEHSVQLTMEEIRRWQTVQKARGYQTANDQKCIPSVMNQLKDVYDFCGISPDKQVLIFPQKRPQTASVIPGDVRTELADVRKPEFTSAKNMTAEDWTNAFLSHNIGVLYARLSGAKATATIATIHPNKRAVLPANMQKYGPVAAYVKQTVSHDARLFEFFDEAGKSLGTFPSKKEQPFYEAFRKIANPQVTLMDGRKARYCKYEKKESKFIYEVEGGSTYKASESEHAQIIEKNDKAWNEAHPGGTDSVWAKDANPVSNSIRGGIQDITSKFFIKNMPAAYLDHKPQDPAELTQLMALVESAVMDSYIPIWQQVVNVVEVDKRTNIIRAGMTPMLQGLKAKDCTAADVELLKKLEEVTAAQLRQCVLSKAKQVAVVQYLEATETPPNVAKYETYTPLGKYKAWMTHRTQGAKTDGDKINIESAIEKEAIAALGTTGLTTVIPETHTPEQVIAHFQTRFLHQLAFTASLVSGEAVAPMTSIADAAKDIGSAHIANNYRSYVERFKSHFELQNPLPYVVTEKEMDEKPTQYVSTEARRNVTADSFIRKDSGVRVTPEMARKFGKADEAAVNPALKALSPLALRFFEDLETAQNAEDPQSAQDLMSTLEARAKGIIDEETNWLVGKLTPEDAKAVLVAVQKTRNKPSHDI